MKNTVAPSDAETCARIADAFAATWAELPAVEFAARKIAAAIRASAPAPTIYRARLRFEPSLPRLRGYWTKDVTLGAWRVVESVRLYEPTPRAVYWIERSLFILSTRKLRGGTLVNPRRLLDEYHAQRIEP